MSWNFFRTLTVLTGTRWASGLHEVIKKSKTLCRSRLPLWYRDVEVKYLLKIRLGDAVEANGCMRDTIVYKARRGSLEIKDFLINSNFFRLRASINS